MACNLPAVDMLLNVVSVFIDLWYIYFDVEMKLLANPKQVSRLIISFFRR